MLVFVLGHGVGNTWILLEVCETFSFSFWNSNYMYIRPFNFLFYFPIFYFLLIIFRLILYCANLLLNASIEGFFFFVTVPVAYGGSWARGPIGASAVACVTATATLNLSHICDPWCSLWQHQILNLLSQARDWTSQRKLRVLNPPSHNGNFELFI